MDLSGSKPQVIVIAAAKDGGERKDVLDGLRSLSSVRGVWKNRGFPVKELYLSKGNFQNPAGIVRTILGLNPLCVFNLFEGFSNDSQKEIDFVRILEGIGIPFTGNPSSTLERCLNKEKVRNILRRENIPVPSGIFIKRPEDLDRAHLEFPVFIKPCFEDASLGIEDDSLLMDRENLYKTVERRLKIFPRGLVIEEFIPGREYNVGFLGDFPYSLLGISVLDYAAYPDCPPFLSYDSKWREDSPGFEALTPSCKEKIAEDPKREIIAISTDAARALGCKGYFRVDLREKEGRLFVLDVNPNPDINRDSGFMRQAYEKGYSYEEVIEKILNLALADREQSPLAGST